MTKYKVKFKHQYTTQYSSLNQSYNDIITIDVDEEWEFDDWINIFTYIYSEFNVVGEVSVTTTLESFKIE